MHSGGRGLPWKIYGKEKSMKVGTLSVTGVVVPKFVLGVEMTSKNDLDVIA